MSKPKKTKANLRRFPEDVRLLTLSSHKGISAKKLEKAWINVSLCIMEMVSHPSAQTTQQALKQLTPTNTSSQVGITVALGNLAAAVAAIDPRKVRIQDCKALSDLIAAHAGHSKVSTQRTDHRLKVRWALPDKVQETEISSKTHQPQNRTPTRGQQQRDAINNGIMSDSRTADLLGHETKRKTPPSVIWPISHWSIQGTKPSDMVSLEQALANAGICDPKSVKVNF